MPTENKNVTASNRADHLRKIMKDFENHRMACRECRAWAWELNPTAKLCAKGREILEETWKEK